MPIIIASVSRGIKGAMLYVKIPFDSQTGSVETKNLSRQNINEAQNIENI